MPSSTRIRLIVLFGGQSAEHDISRVSALHVLNACDPQRYEVVPIGIERGGTWRLGNTENDDSDAKALQIDGPEVNPFDVIRGSGITPGSGSIESGTTVVFPVLHGPNGEDGTVQGLLETAGVAYVGAGVLGSAISMDKAVAKTILGAHGIAQPAWQAIRYDEASTDGHRERLEEIVSQLGEVLFVKPANMGSSIGVSKVTGSVELATGIDLAFAYDDVVVIEEAVDAREIETAVLGNEKPVVGSVGEILPAADFYDYEDKYHDGRADTVIPAQLQDGTIEQIRTVAVAAYRALRAEGMARVDLFVNEHHPDLTRRVMVNEINTIPGFTPISMYPQLWEHAGVSYAELIDQLVELALHRHNRMARRRVDVISSREPR